MNQLAAALPILSEGAIGEANILIVPSANAPCRDFRLVGGFPDKAFITGQLDPSLFTYYSQTAWLSIYNRTRVVESEFTKLPDRCTIVPDTINCKKLKYDRPSDYPVTIADDVDEFMIRLKNSLLQDTELLSNAGGYWMPGALAANNWNTKTLKILGSNAGFLKCVKRILISSVHLET